MRYVSAGIVAVLLLAAVIAARPGGSAHGSKPLRPPATVPDPRPQAPAFLVALAAREAAGNCDSHPDSAVYLRTTRQTAEAMAGDGVDSDQPVYLVQLRGHFVDYGAHGIYRRRDDFPRGTAVTFNVDARTHGILDFGIGGPAAGLPQLGEVHDFTAELIVVPTWPLPKLC